jgi:hypothetical protein
MSGEAIVSSVAVFALAVFMYFLFRREDDAPETSGDIRGVPDEKLARLSNEQLLCVGLARLMEAQGCADDALIKELYERGKRTCIKTDTGDDLLIYH